MLLGMISLGRQEEINISTHQGGIPNPPRRYTHAYINILSVCIPWLGRGLPALGNEWWTGGDFWRFPPSGDGRSVVAMRHIGRKCILQQNSLKHSMGRDFVGGDFVGEGGGRIKSNSSATGARGMNMKWGGWRYTPSLNFLYPFLNS